VLGMPRRMAYYDYTHPALQAQAWTVIVSTMGGLLLVISAFLFVFILARPRKRIATPLPYTFSEAIHAPTHTPVALNTFGLWVAMMIALTLVNYGWPIAQMAMLEHAYVPVIPVGSR
jgi:cytochrome c oxidase subunit I